MAYCVPSMIEVWGFSPIAKKNRHRGEERAHLVKHRDLRSVPSTCREARCYADTHILV